MFLAAARSGDACDPIGVFPPPPGDRGLGSVVAELDGAVPGCVLGVRDAVSFQRDQFGLGSGEPCSRDGHDGYCPHVAFLPSDGC